MFALNRILVPTNLGEPSRTAIQYGVAFARQFGAKLFLLHVLDAKDLDAALETERVLEVLSPDETERAEQPSRARSRSPATPRGTISAVCSTRQDEQDTRAEYLLRASGMAGPGDAIVACARELEVRADRHGQAPPRLRRAPARAAASPRKSCATRPAPC